MAKREKKNIFGWKQPKTYNRQDLTHGKKQESDKYSFRLPSGKKQRKIWCSPKTDASVIKPSRNVGRALGEKPLYDKIDTYNYQSEDARFQKAFNMTPELVYAGKKVFFYQASDGCYFHCVTAPDLTFEDIIDSELPPEFWEIMPPDFYDNFPNPAVPTPGEPLFPPAGNRMPKYGCTNPRASNYDPDADIDDGSCELPGGCMDPEAENYDPEATYDDGSCVYLEKEVISPEGPCFPPTCTLAPKYDSRWISVTEEQALSGQGCPANYVNNGYVNLPDGSYQVLCTYTEQAATNVERIWYRYPNGNWQKVDSANGGLYCWYAEGVFNIVDDNGQILANEGVRPIVYLGCDYPEDVSEEKYNSKLQSETCPPIEEEDPPIEEEDPPIEEEDPPIEEEDPPIEDDKYRLYFGLSIGVTNGFNIDYPSDFIEASGYIRIFFENTISLIGSTKISVDASGHNGDYEGELPTNLPFNVENYSYTSPFDGSLKEGRIYSFQAITSRATSEGYRDEINSELVSFGELFEFEISGNGEIGIWPALTSAISESIGSGNLDAASVVNGRGFSGGVRAKTTLNGDGTQVCFNEYDLKSAVRSKVFWIDGRRDSISVECYNYIPLIFKNREAWYDGEVL